MIRTRQGGWSNDKGLTGVRRLTGAVGEDPLAVAATAVVSACGLAGAAALSKPGRLAFPLVAAVAIGAGWRSRLGNRRVSYLVSQDRWEQREQAVKAGYQVEVDVGRLAKAIDPDGTVHDVLVTCRRRDAAAVGVALGVQPPPGQDQDRDQATGATRARA